MAKNPLMNISIPRRSRVCARSGEKLTPGCEYLSILTEGKGEGELLREDILMSWWNENGSNAELEEAKSSWRGKIPEKKETPVTKEEYIERAFELFYEHLRGHTEDDAVKSFLIALYLARKKKLVLRQEMVVEGNITYLYEVIESEEMIPIPVVEPTVEDVENLQQMLNDEIGLLS